MLKTLLVVWLLANWIPRGLMGLHFWITDLCQTSGGYAVQHAPEVQGGFTK